jgi:hypothetical protein
VITPTVEAYTSLASILKFILLIPAGILTEDCTATAEEEDVSATTIPPAGAGPVNSTRLPVNIVLLPTGVVSSVTRATETGPTCTDAEAVRPFAEAVMVADFNTVGTMVLNPKVPVVKPALITMDGLNT